MLPSYSTIDLGFLCKPDVIAARLHTIQKLLSPLEPQKRHNDIKSKRIDNTGEWIFETEAYQAWIANTTPEDSILFLHGMPGAGKTFLS